jgi:hypothetical protein
MTKAEAIARLSRSPDPVEPGRLYEVGDFIPEDAKGVASLFYRVYGEAYPIDMYYIPDRIREACASGDLFPAVARLKSGEVVGFTALYRSSSPFSGLMEFGLGAVHPAYRGSFVLYHISAMIMDMVRDMPHVEDVFGEAVCDAVIMQHAISLFGFRETGIELGLMPAKAPGEDRTSCLVMSINVRDHRRPLHHPACLTEQIRWLVARGGLDREVSAVAQWSPAADTRLETQVFPSAGVLRANVFCLGPDWEAEFLELENRATASGCVLIQLFLNTGESSAIGMVPFLLRRGYAFGGLIPRWFDDDALLIQKLSYPIDVGGIALYSDEARHILSMALEKGDSLSTSHPDLRE